MEEFMRNASPEMQQQLMQQLEESHSRDMRNLFNGLTERCFKQCVNNFRGLDITSPEKTCVDHCVGKFLKSYGRIGQRFAEHQQAQQAEMRRQMQQGGGMQPGGMQPRV